MRACRILFVTSGATGGGAEKQLIYLLKLLDRKLFEPTVLTILSPTSSSRWGDGDFRPEVSKLGIKVESLDADQFADPDTLLRLVQFLRQEERQIIQTYGLKVDLITRFALWRSSARLVASIRGTENQRGRLGFLLEGLTSPAVSLYISNTACAKSVFSRRSGINPSRIAVIPNGIDAGAFEARSSQEDAERLRRKLGLVPDDLLAVTVANLLPAKGHEDIVEAVRCLCSANKAPNLKFAFCGADCLGSRLQLQVKGANLEDRIYFLGHRTDVPTVLRAADICISASHWEGMPNGILEAMAMGLPVIATRVGGVPEVIVDGESGILVEPKKPSGLAKALQRLASDAAQRCRLGATGYQRVRSEFTPDAMASKTQAAYLSLLDWAATSN